MTEPYIYRNPSPLRNDTLILMQAHGGMEEALARNWPWLLRSGCDILVTSPEDDPLKAFQGPLLGKVIQNPPADYYKLQERAVMAFELCLSQLRTRYDSLMLLHYDCVFLGPLPTQRPQGMNTAIEPRIEARHRSKIIANPPWWFDWESLEKFVEASKQHPIDYEYGLMDRWFPAICEEHGIPIQRTELISYCCNSVDAFDKIEPARKSIRDGRVLVHGVKHKFHLDWVLETAAKAGIDLTSEPDFNPMGFWEEEHRRNDSYCYGKEASYRKAAELLSACETVEDWGCGSGYARRFFDDKHYRGVDGSASKFCDVVDDLRERESKPDGVLLRHVLEHNLEWRRVIKNALRCAQKRLVVVFFMEWGEKTTVYWEECGRPCIKLARKDVLDAVKPLVPDEIEVAGEIVWTLNKL